MTLTIAIFLKLGLGYGHTLTDFSHHLQEAGISQGEIDGFFATNPANVLSVKNKS